MILLTMAFLLFFVLQCIKVLQSWMQDKKKEANGSSKMNDDGSDFEDELPAMTFTNRMRDPDMSGIKSKWAVGGDEVTHHGIKRVTISNMSCHGLKGMDFGSKSDPYLELLALDGSGNNLFEKHQYKTAIVNDNNDPQWEEIWEVELPAETRKLVFEVYDHDLGGGHEYMGEAVVNTRLLPEGEDDNRDFDLEQPDTKMVVGGVRGAFRAHFKVVVLDQEEYKEEAIEQPTSLDTSETGGNFVEGAVDASNLDDTSMFDDEEAFEPNFDDELI